MASKQKVKKKSTFVSFFDLISGTKRRTRMDNAINKATNSKKKKKK